VAERKARNCSVTPRLKKEAADYPTDPVVIMERLWVVHTLHRGLLVALQKALRPKPEKPLDEPGSDGT